MSRKIFTAIWGAALAVFAASLVFIMGVSYNYFTGVQMKQLHAETALAAQGLSLCGKDYCPGLSTGDCRVTWIDADGTVLFDTGADASRMETHLEREEIRQALQNGTGEARRYSPTLADRQLYAAQRLPDRPLQILGKKPGPILARRQPIEDHAGSAICHRGKSRDLDSRMLQQPMIERGFLFRVCGRRFGKLCRWSSDPEIQQHFCRNAVAGMLPHGVCFPVLADMAECQMQTAVRQNIHPPRARGFPLRVHIQPARGRDKRPVCLTHGFCMTGLTANLRPDTGNSRNLLHLIHCLQKRV